MKISNLDNTHTMRVGDDSVVFRHILGRSEALLVGGLTAILALGVGGAPANAQSRFTQNAGNVRPNRTAPAADAVSQTLQGARFDATKSQSTARQAIPYTPLTAADIAPGASLAPETQGLLANGKPITVAEYLRQRNLVEEQLNLLGFTSRTPGTVPVMLPTFGTDALSQQVMAYRTKVTPGAHVQLGPSAIQKNQFLHFDNRGDVRADLLNNLIINPATYQPLVAAGATSATTRPPVPAPGTTNGTSGSRFGTRFSQAGGRPAPGTTNGTSGSRGVFGAMGRTKTATTGASGTISRGSFGTTRSIPPKFAQNAGANGAAGAANSGSFTVKRSVSPTYAQNTGGTGATGTATRGGNGATGSLSPGWTRIPGGTGPSVTNTRGGNGTTRSVPPVFTQNPRGTGTAATGSGRSLGSSRSVTPVWTRNPNGTSAPVSSGGPINAATLRVPVSPVSNISRAQAMSQIVPLQDHRFWNYNWGSDYFGAYYNGTFDATGNAVKPADLNHSDVNASEFHTVTQGKIGVKLLTASADVLGYSGNYDAMNQSKTVHVGGGVYVAGFKVWSDDKTGPDHAETTVLWEKPFDIHTPDSLQIPIFGPIYVSVQIGTSGKAGVTYSYSLYSSWMSGNLTPYIQANIYASAGLGIGVSGVDILEVGADVNLTLINESLEIGSNVGVGWLSNFYLQDQVYCYDTLETLNGHLDVYAKLPDVSFGPISISGPKYTTTLFDWGGVHTGGYLYNENHITPLSW